MQESGFEIFLVPITDVISPFTSAGPAAGRIQTAIKIHTAIEHFMKFTFPLEDPYCQK
jgi:hypothetical protein